MKSKSDGDEPGLPGSCQKRLHSVNRRLFGPVDHNQNRRDLSRIWMEISEHSSEMDRRYYPVSGQTGLANSGSSTLYRYRRQSFAVATQTSDNDDVSSSTSVSFRSISEPTNFRRQSCNVSMPGPVNFRSNIQTDPVVTNGADPSGTIRSDSGPWRRVQGHSLSRPAAIADDSTANDPTQRPGRTVPIVQITGSDGITSVNCRFQPIHSTDQSQGCLEEDIIDDPEPEVGTDDPEVCIASGSCMVTNDTEAAVDSGEDSPDVVNAVGTSDHVISSNGRMCRPKKVQKLMTDYCPIKKNGHQHHRKQQKRGR